MDTNENNGSGRASYSEEERRELIEEFNASGLSQAAFCREWNINPKTFARWMRIERDGEAKASFLEVEVGSGGPVPAGEVRVCLPNRIEVVVRVDSVDELACVLREAAGCLG